MLNKLLYERYHGNIKLQKRIITINDFTYKNILNRIVEYVPSRGKVLDIGSATGTLSFFLASKGLQVDGIELSKNAVKYANLNKNAFGLNNINFVNTSIENFKTNKKYKLITCLEVLEHLEDDSKSLRTFTKFMSRNSILVLSVPSIKAPLYKLGLLNKFDKNVGHHRRYSMQSLKSLLRKSGFEVVEEFKTEGILRSLFFTNKIFGSLLKFTKFRVFNNLLSYCDNLTLHVFSESQIIVICKLS